MAPKKRRRKPGPPARYARRPTLTIRLQAAPYRAIKESAAAHGKSLSEEIEDRLTIGLELETARRQLEEMRENTTKMHAMAASVLTDAAAERTAARVQAIRAAGLTILREIEGRPTRVVVDLETLLAEADGIAGGLRSDIFDENPPAREEIRTMTAQEAKRLMDEIELIKRRLEAAQAAAKKPGDSEA
jgi:hypothetical protein